MRYELLWTISAQRDLQYLDRVSIDRITRKILWFSQQSNPLRYAEPLTGLYTGIFRFRVGDYRALFKKDAKGQFVILVILRVKHRREAYK